MLLYSAVYMISDRKKERSSNPGYILTYVQLVNRCRKLGPVSHFSEKGVGGRGFPEAVLMKHTGTI